MSLPFSTVCLLWEQLSSPDGANQVDSVMKQWFEQYVSSIEQTDHALALVSCLLPRNRSDRVYGLGEKHITAIVVQAWGIGTSRRQALQKLQDNENVDCASAIIKTVTESGDLRGSQTPLTVKEVDATLDRIAATCNFSSPDLRKRHDNSSGTTALDLLVDIFRCISALKVKWAVRLLLKDLRPAVILKTLTLQLVYSGLPCVLQVLNTLSYTLAFIYSEEDQ